MELGRKSQPNDPLSIATQLLLIRLQIRERGIKESMTLNKTQSILGGCYTSVYAVLGIYCTCCMYYPEYAVLGVNS